MHLFRRQAPCRDWLVRHRPHAPAPSTPSAPQQVQGLQNSLAAVNEAPGLGLSEAAELLRAELRVDLVR